MGAPSTKEGTPTIRIRIRIRIRRFMILVPSEITIGALDPPKYVNLITVENCMGKYIFHVFLKFYRIKLGKNFGVSSAEFAERFALSVTLRQRQSLNQMGQRSERK